jgi:hypothetical protein
MRFDRIRDHRPIRDGFSVCESRIRFGNYFHLMREIVHLHNGWIARVPSLDVKSLLGIHVYEDATFVRRIRMRLQELEVPGTYPASPGEKLQQILDFLNSISAWEEYVAAVYSVIKPGLMDAWESHFTASDPLLDEPSQRLIARFIQITSQHISGGMALVESMYQLDPDTIRKLQESTHRMRDLWSGMGGDFGTVSLTIGTKRHPHSKPPLPGQVREGFHRPKPAGAAPSLVAALEDALTRSTDDEVNAALRLALHDQLNRQVAAAEAYSLSSHENPDAPWEFHEVMCRMVWDKIRHAQALDKLLATLGGHWGEHPLEPEPFGPIHSLATPTRLRRLAEPPQGLLDADRHARLRGTLTERNRVHLANLLDNLQAEAVFHQRVCEKWSASLGA